MLTKCKLVQVKPRGKREINRLFNDQRLSTSSQEKQRRNCDQKSAWLQVATDTAATGASITLPPPSSIPASQLIGSRQKERVTNSRDNQLASSAKMIILTETNTDCRPINGSVFANSSNVLSLSLSLSFSKAKWPSTPAPAKRSASAQPAVANIGLQPSPPMSMFENNNISDGGGDIKLVMLLLQNNNSSDRSSIDSVG